MKKLCEGKPDWKCIEIPLVLKFNYTKDGRNMYFVMDKPKGAQSNDQKAK